MRKVLTLIIAALIACYPFIIYYGIHYFSTRYIGLVIALVFCLRFLSVKNSKSSGLKMAAILITCVGIAISLAAAIWNNQFVMKLYPFAISLILLAIFGYSVFKPPTIIERIARLTTPKLTPRAIQYTYKVTISWCIFFIINAAISLWTALFSSMKVWVLYNGFISYILIGSFFCIEFLIRLWVKRKDNILAQKK